MCKEREPQIPARATARASANRGRGKKTAAKMVHQSGNEVTYYSGLLAQIWGATEVDMVFSKGSNDVMNGEKVAFEADEEGGISARGAPKNGRL